MWGENPPCESFISSIKPTNFFHEVVCGVISVAIFGGGSDGDVEKIRATD